MGTHRATTMAAHPSLSSPSPLCYPTCSSSRSMCSSSCPACHPPQRWGGRPWWGGVHPHWRAVAASIDATPAVRLRLARELEAYLTKQYVVATRCQRAVAQLRLAVAAPGAAGRRPQDQAATCRRCEPQGPGPAACRGQLGCPPTPALGVTLAVAPATWRPAAPPTATPLLQACGDGVERSSPGLAHPALHLVDRCYYLV